MSRFQVVVSSGYEIKPYDHREYKPGYLEHEILILDSACGFKVMKSKVVKTVTHRGARALEVDARLQRYITKMERAAAELEEELARC